MTLRKGPQNGLSPQLERAMKGRMSKASPQKVLVAGEKDFASGSGSMRNWPTNSPTAPIPLPPKTEPFTMINRTLAIAIAAFGSISATQGALLFYEGFNYTDGTQLHGQGGWSNDPNDTYDGTTPATVGNTGSDDPFEIFDGTGAEAWDGDFTGVTQTGNFAGYEPGHLFATRSLHSTVTSTFTDGATTWFSFINYRTTAEVPSSRSERARQPGIVAELPLTRTSGWARSTTTKCARFNLGRRWGSI